MRGPQQRDIRDSDRFTVHRGGRAAPYVRDDGFSPPASLTIPVEDYQAVRLADLIRIRDRLAEAPRESAAWGNAAWAFFGLGGGAVTAAVAFEPTSSVPSFSLLLLAGALLAIATLCGVAQIMFNDERRRTQDEALADLDRTIAELEASRGT